MCEFISMRGMDYRELGPDATPQQIAELDQRGSRAHVVPAKKGMAKAQLQAKNAGRELGWTGGKAGT
jgi:hypothetical protein